MLFFRQLFALCVKNWIILAKHPVLTIVRCLISPIGCAVVLAYAQFFLSRPGDDGIGTITPVAALKDTFDGTLKLPWSDDTSGIGVPTTPRDIMSRVTQGFSSKQLSAVMQVDSDQIGNLCQQNFNGVSDCFASVLFDAAPAAGSNATFNYTIRADSHLAFVDVKSHASDYEVRILPLQWAIESAFIELETGVSPPTPLEWPFTQSTTDAELQGIRISYLGLIENYLVIAFFAAFIGTGYHLAGAAMEERASGLTSQMKATGLFDSARVISWHLSISLAYLPGWIVIAVLWHVKVFTGTSAGILIGLHLLLGLSLTSWSMFLMAPFGKSPQLAAIVSMVLSFLFVVIGFSMTEVSMAVAVILSLLFPPYFYPMAIRCICNFETQFQTTSATEAAPISHLILWPLFLVAAVNVFLWPWLGAVWERYLYDAQNPSDGLRFWARRSKNSSGHSMTEGVAISMRNVGKEFRPSIFSKKKDVVTAISDLSLDIPKNGIYVLLGPNGQVSLSAVAGKSTVMSILAGLTGRTRGTVVFEGGSEQPPRGSIGIVPQKNVLLPDLSCYQTLHLWRMIKPPVDDLTAEEDIVQTLRDCDLGDKLNYNAESLSGGQKRKLQLAIGLVGGSKILLVDECTSGVDPLSRRAIWKTLTAVKHDRTIVFTTHFLDEADLLADEIAVLAAPGKLVAYGNPVSLKSNLGEGYTLKVTYSGSQETSRLLEVIRPLAARAHASTSGTTNQALYHLKTSDSAIVSKILNAVDRNRDRLGIESYSVSAASIEDIFLDLIQEAEHDGADARKLDVPSSPELPELPRVPSVPPRLELTRGSQRSMLGQALTIFHKRVVIARRNYFVTPLLAMAVLIVASCLPLAFVPPNGQACVVSINDDDLTDLFLPTVLGFQAEFGDDNFPGTGVLDAPPGIIDTLGNSTVGILRASGLIHDLPDNATFVDTIMQTFRTQFTGGISMDLNSGNSLFAWQADSHSPGMILLNTVSNILYNKALNDTGRGDGTSRLIIPSFGTFPEISEGNLKPLKWAAVFTAAMAVFPAFFTLYVAQERRSSVQAMQFSNGLSNPAGLWLGHLMFDSLFSIVSASILVGVFAAKSTLFHGLGYLWLVMVLYGFTGTLFAYCFSLFITSPLTAFAAVAAYQVVIFALYIMAYVLSFTYAEVAFINRDLTMIHFTVSIISPVCNVLRAALIAINLFSLLCKGSEVTSSLGDLTHFGGPILYLIINGLLLFLLLVWVDSGSSWRHALSTRIASVGRRRRGADPSAVSLAPLRPDVVREAEEVAHAEGAALRVLNVSKTFGRNKVVDSVSFGVQRDTIFALIGPNGAGKTTTFNIIRGDTHPDHGDVLINGRSITRHTQSARESLGVCPQFTAIDAQLSVREHLRFYARLKGVRRGAETARDVEAVMRATGLDGYADRLASALSGGNQRKLALAIALIGDPSVILIDEFSTGIDAKMKREMWATLKNVSVGKAIVITTHSMEEASTLADKVGILAKRMLAVGPLDALVDRYATYLVHFPCRSRADVRRAEEIMARIPGARMADDVATRFEVPVVPPGAGEKKEGRGRRMSLAELFGVLAEAGAGEYAVEEASLESVFMKVIKENEMGEVDGEARAARRKWWWLC
ncbi:P-loop containing nucleoside triphosphate hydrolase protein [Trametes coccinea BRFM310]|uniref:p-loop containing nucleoside triphosphate hydrolase protein n=1 Tax=Trametes coccinea (strain BRFM310) TaxID=1353009 RepID=A0A1Y2IJ86_TRAC3|nr:P-loop containing nucleoside triphosphate hydrolase protein [Trametes coccinea BRFM310]